jgi:general secretion pathway protein K
MKKKISLWLARTPLGDQDGVALIAVVWIFIFLFVVAFEFSTSAREEATAAQRFSDETLGYYLALAGFERGLYDFLNQQNPAAQTAQAPEAKKNDPFDGEFHEEDLGTGAFRVRLVDESGKININRVNDETLRRIFTNLGLDEARRDILVDSIMDWRDADDLHRTNGAENDYYASLSPPYSAKNGPLDSVEDLLWIKGMTPELFFGYSDETSQAADGSARTALREIFTVDSPIDRVNLRTASAEVIHALTGIPLEKCRGFVEERKKLSEKSLADCLPLLGISAADSAIQAFIFTNPSVIAVEAEGRPSSSRGSKGQRIVRLGAPKGSKSCAGWTVTFPYPAAGS